MPESPTARFGLEAISGSDFIDDLDAIDQAQIAILEAKGVRVDTGTLSARPTSSGSTAGIPDRIYRSTDAKTVDYDTGAGWINLASSRGRSNISASESRTNTAFGTLTTPDQVTGIVLPTDGLIAVWYQAMWQNSAAGAGQAAIFVGSNQMTVQGWDAVTGHQPLPEAAYNPQAGKDEPLFSFQGGLGSGTSGTAFTADVTTGQAVGFANIGGGTIGIWIGANACIVNESATGSAGSAAGIAGGPCYLFAAAGTYTVSVQFKASSGSVTVAKRKLWVQALSFS